MKFVMRGLLLALALCTPAPAQFNQVPGYGLWFDTALPYGSQTVTVGTWNNEPVLIIASRPNRNGEAMIAGTMGPGIPVRLEVLAFAVYTPIVAHQTSTVDVAYGLERYAMNYITSPSSPSPWRMSGSMMFELFPPVVRKLQNRQWPGRSSWMGCWWYWTLCNPAPCGPTLAEHPRESITICRVRLG